MKLRKLLIICAIMAVMMTLLAISISAEDITINMDYIESITTDADEGTTWGSPENMFDGNLHSESVNSWYCSNGWAFPAGKTGTIVFVDEFEIVSVNLYAWSNWSGTTILFYDAEGNETAKYTNGNFGSTDGAAIDLGISGIKAKKMTFKTDHSKGTRNHTYTEFIIEAIHEHKYTKVQTVISEATCTIPGSAIYECNCGLTEVKDIPATGEHTEPEETVIFRDGFGKPGFKGTICRTCDTQDVVIEEIGPLFNLLGYSVCTFGDHGIQFGVGVNYDNLAKYKEITGNDVMFGTVIASRNTLTEGNPMEMGDVGLLTVNDKIAMTDLTSSDYLMINSKLTFDSSCDDTEIIMALYVCTGDAIYYVGEGTSYDVVTVTYNSIANPS